MAINNVAKYRLKLRVWQFGLLAALFIIWWALTKPGLIPAFVFDNDNQAAFFFGEPIVIFSRIWDWFIVNADIYAHLWTTLIETILAFAVGTVTGGAVGMWLALSPFAAAVADPFIKGLNSMPRVILAPIFAVWFGLGIASKVALGVTLVFFIVFFNVYQGVREVNPNVLASARMLGANRKANLELITEVVERNGALVSSDQDSGSNTLIVRYPNSIEVDGIRSDYNSAERTEEMIAINRKIADEVVSAFKAKYGDSVEVKANPEMINATASENLIQKALLSVGIAMLLMLIYIAFRFDFFSGLAALCAQFHDVLIMLSLVIIFRIQINSSLIAGIITIVAYSINNTIVIFDRVRENMAPYKHTDKSKLDFGYIIDTSVTESLTRALFTSFTTLITIIVLAAWGVQSLTDFALPIIFGILAGLYSSIFVAPSIWGLMMNARRNKQRKARKAAAVRGRRR